MANSRHEDGPGRCIDCARRSRVPSQSAIHRRSQISPTHTKEMPNRAFQPLAHPLFFASASDNKDEGWACEREHKGAGFRAANPVSATHFRRAPLTPLFAIAFCNKPETRFRKALMDSQKLFNVGSWGNLGTSVLSACQGKTHLFPSIFGRAQWAKLVKQPNAWPGCYSEGA